MEGLLQSLALVAAMQESLLEVTKFLQENRGTVSFSPVEACMKALLHLWNVKGFPPV